MGRSASVATLRGVAESNQTIVIVEDDQGIREMLGAVLTSQGYAVTFHADGESAIADPLTRDAGLVVLDVGLPGMSGFEVCTALRQQGRDQAVLMLTARHDVADRVRGLDSGADDYLSKPFALDELLARVRAALRRGPNPGQSTDERLTLGDLRIDLGVRQASRDGKQIDLTKIEFDLLALLVANSPRVLPRDLILERVWGHEIDIGSNSLEVFVSNLRKKLETGSRSRLIHTVRGVGYAARSS